ncbi:hypothetical protein [Arthrobacter sp. ERGS1:01]|uniref:hypothetical protein n=1 Tax=Arthrobacter sp. ERGS1:01 TaxID=1704044 RepID=UPI000AF8D7FF|nr:hypothetical protein [Arthrobacter sp. ERGS1:01]
MTGERTLEGIHRFDWETIVRRVQMPLATKGIALLLATYSDTPTGESIYPGHTKLAAVACASKSTVERAIKTLRSIGLIEEVAPGRSRGRNGGGLAAVYRLTLPSDLMESVAMLDPDEKVLCVPGHPPAAGNDPSPVTVDSANDPSSVRDHLAINHPSNDVNHPSNELNHPSFSDESSVTQDDPPTHLPPTHLTPPPSSPSVTVTSARDVKARGADDRDGLEIDSMDDLGGDGKGLSEEQNRQWQLRKLEDMMKREQSGAVRA